MTNYIGDFVAGSIIRKKFNTFSQSSAPTTPSVAMTFAVYKNSTTETTDGVTVSADYDGKTGLHMVSVDTSSNAVFYAVGEDYDVVFTAGTVDGKDLTKVTLFSFSIENRNRKANAVQFGGQNVSSAGAITVPQLIASTTNITQASGVILAPVTHTGAVIPEVSIVDELSTNALSANGLQDDIAIATLSMLTTLSWPTNSFGQRLLVGNTTQRTVAVTGSNHVAADIHELQPGVLTDADFDANSTYAKLASMIESDGLGQFRFDSIAVSLAGGGGGGGTDWTSNERAAIRLILGFNSSGILVDPSSGILDEIRDKTALINSGGIIYVNTPVTASGKINGPLIIGDDYLAANGRAFTWTVPLPSGYSIATSSCKFGMSIETELGDVGFIVTGSLSDAGGGNVTLSFDVARTVNSILVPAWYKYSVEIISADGTEITKVKSGKNVEWQQKQT